MKWLRGLMHNQDGGGNGGAAGTATAPANSNANANGNGNAAPAAFDWKALNLEPELQNVVDRHQFDHPKTVLKSYDNLEKLHGVPPDRIIKLPKDGDPPEAWKEVHKKLGVPDSPTGYKLPVPEGDKGEFAQVAAKWFHEAGVPHGAAVKLAENWNKHMAAEQERQKTAMDAEHSKQVSELKTSWGADYDKRAQLVDRAATEFGVTTAHLDALKKVMGPKATMEFFYNIGSKLGSEGEFVSPDKSGTGDFGAMTPEQAKAEIARLKADTAFRQMFVSPDPKMRSEARAKMDRLTRIAEPGFRTVE